MTGRPVQNSSEAIKLKYGLGLVQILRLDEKNQVLTIRAWNRLVSNLAVRELSHCVILAAYNCEPVTFNNCVVIANNTIHRLSKSSLLRRNGLYNMYIILDFTKTDLLEFCLNLPFTTLKVWFCSFAAMDRLPVELECQ